MNRKDSQSDRCAEERAKRARRAHESRKSRAFSKADAANAPRKFRRKTQGACVGGYCTIIRQATEDRWAAETFLSKPRKCADGQMRRVTIYGRETQNRTVVIR